MSRCAIWSCVRILSCWSDQTPVGGRLNGGWGGGGSATSRLWVEMYAVISPPNGGGATERYRLELRGAGRDCDCATMVASSHETPRVSQERIFLLNRLDFSPASSTRVKSHLLNSCVSAGMRTSRKVHFGRQSDDWGIPHA